MFPQARNLGEYWTNIVAGTDCITDVPRSRWRVEDYYDPDPFAQDKTYCRRGGFLPAMTFDPFEFGLVPRSVDSTGLVQLLSLVVARDVLRDAGCSDASWYDPSRTGVILGVCGPNTLLMPLAARLNTPALKAAVRSCGLSEDDAEEIARRYTAAFPGWTENSFPGVLGNVVAGRIAHRFDFGGANCTVDAACASSLAALKMAVSELVEHRADMMITGGADTDNTIAAFMCFSKTPALSYSGQIRPFDADADGTLVGEGIGMLALKRLADAQRDGNRIYAVLRGIGSSSDGRGASIYAPCGPGQMLALRRAYADADCPPESVGLIEAHGTGTSVGDEVELAALNAVLGAGNHRRFAAVGTVKSQIGHTKAAAGAAGLIKMVLALYHKVLPPTINVDTPSSEASRADGAVYVNTRARPWIRDPRRPVRRGGVSSFGFGGVNVHAVVEEYRQSTDSPVRALAPTPRAYVWHAVDPRTLRERITGAPVAEDDDIPADHARLGFVARDDTECAALRETAIAQLLANPDHESWTHATGIHYRRSAQAGAKVAALFAGQGSQYIDMGLDAVLALPVLRAAFDAANAISGGAVPLAEVVYPLPGSDPERDAQRLCRTEHAQPAIGALAMGQYRYLSELGLVIDAALGHSFGELTALWAAGSLSDDDFLRLAHARGRAMAPPTDRDGYDPGTMAAVRAPAGRIEQALASFRNLLICNRNAPEEVVVGGATTAVEEFLRWCVDQRIPAQPLPVSAAFHTEHIRHAVDAFDAVVATVELSSPAIPVLANTRGASYGADTDANRATLVRQLLEPVDFAGRLEQLHADGVRVFVEFGPRRILTGLVERTLGKRGVTAIATDDGPGRDSAVALKQAAVRLAVLGLPLRDINRYDPVPVEAASPSKLARVLDGPNFATMAVEPAHRAALDTEYQLTPPIAAPPDEAAQRLSLAAAEHLELHSRYLEGQLHTGQRLTELVREGTRNGSAEAITRGVEAIRDHSLALGKAHARANEVLGGLLRSHLDGERSAPAVTPVGQAGLSGGLSRVDTAPGGDPPAFGAPASAAGASVSEPAAAEAAALETTTNGTPPPQGSALAELVRSELGLTQQTSTTHILGTDIDPVEAEQVIRDIVSDKTGYPPDMIESHMDIQVDLGIDSLKQVEIAAEVWKRYPQVPRESLYRFTDVRTVGDLITTGRRLLSEPTLALRAASAPLGRVFVDLRVLPEVDMRLDAYGPAPCALVVDEGGQLAQALIAALRTAGWRIRILALPGTQGSEEHSWRLADWDEQTLAEAIAAITASTDHLNLCVLPLAQTEDVDIPHLVQRLSHTVLTTKHVRDALRTAAGDGTRAALVTLTSLDGSLGYAGSAGRTVAALAGGLGGLVKSLALEAVDLFCRAMDFAPELSADAVAEQFLREIADAATDVREVGYDGALRRTPILVDTAPTPAHSSGPTEVSSDDLILVTGGARGITSWCVTSLAHARHCGFLLLGRTPLIDEPEWAAGLEAEDELRAAISARMGTSDPGAAELSQAYQELAAGREVRATLAQLRDAGVRAEYLAADVADADAVRAVLEPYAGQVTGLIHGAGVLADQWLADKTAAEVTRVLGPKLTGLGAVLAALDPEQLRHLVVFSSVAGIYGNVRQTDYALANEALNRFACAFKEAHPDCRVSAMAFGPWMGGMATPALQELFLQHGVPMLTREQGTAMFVDQLCAARSGELVTVLGPTRAIYTRRETISSGGVTVQRRMADLVNHPVIRDHAFGGYSVLPMTAAVGWCVNVVERMHGGRLVVEASDVKIRRGLVFDGAERDRFLLEAVPQSTEGHDAVAVTVHSESDAGARLLRYEGRFTVADDAPSAPTLPGLPSYVLPEFELNAAYADGLFFHGPTLRGIGPIVDEEQGRTVVVARLAAPSLAGFDGQLYHGATADLLLQGMLLYGKRLCGQRILPVSVAKIEMFAPLPDDEPFLIVVELVSERPVDVLTTVTACDPAGRIYQRWHELSGIVMAPELATRATWVPLAMVDQAKLPVTDSTRGNK